MRRILVIVSKLGAGGAETMIINHIRLMDTSLYHFDFVVFGDEIGLYEDEVRGKGCNVFHVKPISQNGIINYLKEMNKIFKLNGPYDVVHANTDYQIGLALLMAKKNKVPVRIAHAHNEKALNQQGKEINKIKLNFLLFLIRHTATKFLACSNGSAEFFYKKINSQKITIFKNAIDLEKFNIKLPKDKKNYLLNLYGLRNDQFLIGHVGRFKEQKNHKKILFIFKELLKINPNSKLLLIGNGDLFNEIKELSIKLEIEKDVIFLGEISNVNEIYQILDCFVFPSLFEGLPLVLLETQCASLPAVVSDSISKDIDMNLGLINYLSNEDKDIIWVKKILEQKKKDINNTTEIITLKGYNINENINILRRIYS